MKSKIYEKNTSKWLEQNNFEKLDDFISLYEERPIKNNKGGMLFPHMFYFYTVLLNLKPDLVIESGVLKGQSTWLIEKTLPNSQIISLDIDLSKREYISKKAKYISKDFKFCNFSNIPKNTLVFFDDHINHIERIMEANFFGIKNIILEDNYPVNKGDFQTLKQIFNKYIFNHKPSIYSLIKTYILFNKFFFKKIFFKNYNIKKDLYSISNRIRDGYPEENFFYNISSMIDCYYEFPPLIKILDSQNYDFTKMPIFEKIPKKLEKYINELAIFNYFTYIKLK